MLWDLNESKWLYTLETAIGGGPSAPINALCFSPNRYWLCAATGSSVKIWVRPRTRLSLLLLVLGNGIVIRPNNCSAIRLLLASSSYDLVILRVRVEYKNI